MWKYKLWVKCELWGDTHTDTHTDTSLPLLGLASTLLNDIFMITSLENSVLTLINGFTLIHVT